MKLYTPTVEDVNNGKVLQRFRFKATNGPKMYESGSFKGGEFKFKAYDGDERAWFNTEEETQAWFKNKADNTEIRLDIVSTIDNSELAKPAKAYFHRVIKDMSDLQVKRRKASLVAEMDRIIEAPLVANSPWIDDEIKKAWAEGLTGEGVSVAVHDIFPNAMAHHTNEYIINNNQGTHGEHVANIFLGDEEWDTIGIAKDATVIEKSGLPYHWYKRPIHTQARRKINGKWTYIPFSYGGKGITWNGLDIIVGAVHSYGWPVDANINSHKEDDDELGTILIHAAGNGGLSNYWGNKTMYVNKTNQRGFYARSVVNGNTRMYNSEYNNSLILCGVLKPNGQNAGAWAGDFADRYIVDDETPVYGATTSWTAPGIAGKVAIIKQKFPHLSAEDLTALVFDTADDMGSPHIYGHGKINLTRALSASV